MEVATRIQMPRIIGKNIYMELSVLYLINILAAVLCIMYNLQNVGYLLIVASLLGIFGFYHKLNVLAMFSHLCVVSLAFEYTYLSNDLLDGNPVPNTIFYTILIYCPIHVVLASNRLLIFYHYMRKKMRRQLRRKLRRAERSGDNPNRKSRPVSIMQLKEDVDEDEQEQEYDIWKSWQNLFKSLAPFKNSKESENATEMV